MSHDTWAYTHKYKQTHTQTNKKTQKGQSWVLYVCMSLLGVSQNFSGSVSNFFLGISVSLLANRPLCTVLHCIAAYGRVLQGIAAYCRGLQRVAVYRSV